MKLTLLVLVSMTVVFLLGWVVGGYTSLEWNPANWEEASRNGHIFVSILLGMFFGVILYW